MAAASSTHPKPCWHDKAIPAQLSVMARKNYSWCPECRTYIPDEELELMNAEDWLFDRTDDGIEVRMPQDPYIVRDSGVFVDGERVDVLRVRRLRDGGTTFIDTSVGTIVVATPFKPRPVEIRDRKGKLAA